MYKPNIYNLRTWVRIVEQLHNAVIITHPYCDLFVAWSDLVEGAGVELSAEGETDSPVGTDAMSHDPRSHDSPAQRGN